MTEDTSHLEDRQTPQQVSDQIKAEAEGKETPETPAPEQKPEEKPAKTPADSKPEGDAPADKTDVEPEEKPDATLPPKPRTIYEDLKEKKKEAREAKSENETLKNQLADKDAIIADLTKKAQTAETPAEKKEVSDEIKALAEEIGATPEGIAKLTDFLTKTIRPEASPLSQEDRDALARVKESEVQREAQAQFSKEFDTFEPTLKTEFPYVSADDLAVVRKEVDRLAHTAQYHDKEIDYIYFKEKQKLAKLISPKRPSYEGGESRPAGEGEADVELSSRSTPMDAQKATEKRSTSGFEVRSSPSQSH